MNECVLHLKARSCSCRAFASRSCIVPSAKERDNSTCAPIALPDLHTGTPPSFASALRCSVSREAPTVAWGGLKFLFRAPRCARSCCPPADTAARAQYSALRLLGFARSHARSSGRSAERPRARRPWDLAHGQISTICPPPSR